MIVLLPQFDLNRLDRLRRRRNGLQQSYVWL